MPSSVNWYPGHEGRLIQQVFSGALTVEDVAAGSEAVAKHIRDGVHPVHLLADVTSVVSFPKAPTQLKQAAVHFKEPGLGWIVLVGASSMMGMFASLITQLGGVKLRSFPTDEEALEFIAQQDRTFVK